MHHHQPHSYSQAAAAAVGTDASSSSQAPPSASTTSAAAPLVHALGTAVSGALMHALRPALGPPRKPAVHSHASVPDPTPAELANLSVALERLWDLDANRLVPTQDFELNLQDRTFVSGTDDKAPEPLFKFVDLDRVRDLPTFRSFLVLLGAYNPIDGVPDNISPQIRAEEHTFVQAAAQTAPIIYIHKYLVAKGIVEPSFDAFVDRLWHIWFEPYRRVVDNDSSAFQHTFSGEIRDGRVIGFHNWLKFLLEERAGQADYRGFILPRSRSGRGMHPTGREHVLCFQLSWQGEIKNVSTFLIGTSPEYELALFTLCFLAAPGPEAAVPIAVDDVACQVLVRTFQSQRHGPKIGSAYVE
ncbi:hypothetical protein HK405_007089, partial [Cladochytrium tenue]